MNLCRKGTIFFTFFTSCLALSLVAAALSTKWWTVARAKRTVNPGESDGKINLGLFDGEKHLNVKYGWRDYPLNVTDLIRNEQDFAIYGAWVGTICCLAGSLLFSTLAALFAVINTATNPYLPVNGVPGLYVWNASSMTFSLIAALLWILQYIQKFQYNVMSKDDRDQSWNSAGMAWFGFSFWFVVAASIIHFANIIIIYMGAREPKTEITLTPVVEEKTSGAIMLY